MRFTRSLEMSDVFMLLRHAKAWLHHASFRRSKALREQSLTAGRAAFAAGKAPEDEKTLIFQERNAAGGQIAGLRRIVP